MRNAIASLALATTGGRFAYNRPGMSVTWETFERYRQKGLDARRAGQWEPARVYLLEAARAMASLSKDAQGEALREARKAIAERLLELARDCTEAAQQGRKAPAPARRSSAGTGSGGGANSP